MTVSLLQQEEYLSQIQKLPNATTIMHTTGAESMAGVKTFTNGVTIPSGGTLTVTDATITGANSDSILEGSTQFILHKPKSKSGNKCYRQSICW